jgi:ankyrin repeat protein
MKKPQIAITDAELLEAVKDGDLETVKSALEERSRGPDNLLARWRLRAQATRSKALDAEMKKTLTDWNKLEIEDRDKNYTSLLGLPSGWNECPIEFSKSENPITCNGIQWYDGDADKGIKSWVKEKGKDCFTREEAKASDYKSLEDVVTLAVCSPHPQLPIPKKLQRTINKLIDATDKITDDLGLPPYFNEKLLLIAAENEQREVFDELLGHIEINDSNRFENNPICLAAPEAKYAILKMAIETKAKTTKANRMPYLMRIITDPYPLLLGKWLQQGEESEAEIMDTIQDTNKEWWGDKGLGTYKTVLGLSDELTRCAIREEAATNPVTYDGEYWYEKEKLEQWFDASKQDPATRAMVTIGDYLNPAELLREAAIPKAKTNTRRHPGLIRLITDIKHRAEQRYNNRMSPEQYEQLLFLELELGEHDVVSSYLPNIKKINRNKSELLLIAAKRKHEKVIEILLTAGENIALAIEHAQGQPEVTNYLVSIQKAQGLKLCEYALRGDPRIKDLLDDGVDADFRNTEGKTALFLAAENGHEGVVRRLLAAKANTEITPAKSFVTPLFAATQNSHLKVLQALLEAGANTGSRRNYEGNKAMLALFDQEVSRRNNKIINQIFSLIKICDTQKARSLLQENTNLINTAAESRLGNTFLSVAIEWQNKDLVDDLLMAKANTEAFLPDGKTALWLAVNALINPPYLSNYRFRRSRLEYNPHSTRPGQQIVKLLLSAKARIDRAQTGKARATEGLYDFLRGIALSRQNQLKQAIIDGEILNVSHLLEQGILNDPILPAAKLLELAAKHDHIKALLSVLLEHKVNIGASGGAFLHQPAKEGKADWVEKLLSLKANPNQTLPSLTPLYEALAGNHQPVIELLINAGAKLAPARKSAARQLDGNEHILRRLDQVEAELNEQAVAAIKSGQTQQAKNLIKQSGSGSLDLIVAAHTHRQTRITQDLVKAAGGPNRLLSRAATHDNRPCIKVALELSASPDWAVTKACMNGNSDVVRVLLDSKAMPRQNITNHSTTEPDASGLQVGRTGKTNRFFGRLPTHKRIYTPLFIAALYNKPKVFELLLRAELARYIDTIHTRNDSSYERSFILGKIRKGLGPSVLEQKKAAAYLFRVAHDQPAQSTYQANQKGLNSGSLASITKLFRKMDRFFNVERTYRGRLR